MAVRRRTAPPLAQRSSLIVKAHIEGLKEAEAALAQLPKATARNVLRRVLKPRAEALAAHARILVPVGFGDLRELIIVSTQVDKRQRRDHAPIKSGVEMFVGTSRVPQGIWQEFGTSQHGAQPFMRPVWDSDKEGLLEHLGRDLWAEIKKAADRQAKKQAKLLAKAGAS